mgnify:CR=1 FL=1
MEARIKIFFLVLVILSAFNYRLKTVRAFELLYAGKETEIREDTLESFKGIGVIAKKNLLEKQDGSQTALKKYLGLGTEKTVGSQIFSASSESTNTAIMEINGINGAPANFNKFQERIVIYKNRPEKIYNYLKTLSGKINIAKAEPSLELKNTTAVNQAVNFTPPKDGLSLDIFSSTLIILGALERSEPRAELAIEIDKPLKSLAETNPMGINELIATGESNFKGSPKNRIHNIKVGLTKFKGAIIAPGEEFSFNKILGPVEAENGFLPELVIKKTGTVPEFGGGLCQVSSTTFRAAMKAGIPITQRKNHSYAVQYYSPQGTDATIYPGVIELKFINDTPGHILVWPYIKDSYTLIFEFYGTRDERKVTLQKPFSYDRKTDGSMKAEWTRIVENGGKTATSTFKSVYQSPALFHKQETYPTAAPSTGVQMPTN